MKTNSYRWMVPVAMIACNHAIAQTQIPYNHGNPTREEQFILELINRARANPAAEGQRLANEDDSQVKLAISYFGVDVAKLRRDFSSYPVRPPIAMTPTLLAAARRHSNDMARRNFQSHTGSDGSSIVSRIRESGFSGQEISESIYSSLVNSTGYAHAGLTVDWGNGPGGLQPGLGHRMNTLNFSGPIFREIGIGVASRTGADADRYGKFAVTENLGTRVNSPFFLLGVVYNDRNGNGTYDPGEGMSGVRVSPSVGPYYATTSHSGGYAIPFDLSPGESTVVFSGGGLISVQTRPFTLIRANTKVDVRVVTPVPVVRLEMIDSITSESGKAKGGTAMFRVKRGGPTTGELRLNLSRTIKSGTGKAIPNDYKMAAVSPAKLQAPSSKAKSFTMVIPAGRAYGDIRISAIKDKRKEPTETVKFAITGSSAYKISAPSSVVISIKK